MRYLAHRSIIYAGTYAGFNDSHQQVNALRERGNRPHLIFILAMFYATSLR